MDTKLKKFAKYRKQYYRSLIDGFKVKTLGQTSANKSKFYNTLRNTSGCHSVAFSSHGTPGVVHNKSPGRILISLDDDTNDLKLLASNRWIYMFSCESANRVFTEKLLGFGAKGVIGYEKKAEWKYNNVWGLWRELDLGILSCLLHQRGKGSIELKKQKIINKIDGRLNILNQTQRKDHLRMRHAVDTMTIET